VSILALRTDNPHAELYLIDVDGTLLRDTQWEAHRELSATIHTKMMQLLHDSGISLTDIRGIVFYKGPGSFTGLRIGVSVANALAASLKVPVIGVNGEDWLKSGVDQCVRSHGFSPIEPFYGSEAHITLPKK